MQCEASTTITSGKKGRSRALLIFLDGVGIGVKNPRRNPFFHAKLPFLRELFGGTLPSLSERSYWSDTASFFSANATLHVAGLPQSGTGQSALYTGINTARLIRQHFGPYLHSRLKPVVASQSIFEQLKNSERNGFDVAFANAFPHRFFEYLQNGHQRMVAGMYAALSSEIPFRTKLNLNEGSAVSTDITGARWREIGEPDAPVISPFSAGINLARVAMAHHFTLFEYFLTDKAGHERSIEFAVELITSVDEFLRGVFEGIDRESMLVIVTSDHGNIEDLSVKTHTRNPVPVLLFGKHPLYLHQSIRSISDITPALIKFLRY